MKLAQPNGFELCCPATQAKFDLLSCIVVGQKPSNFPQINQVSCSELLGDRRALGRIRCLPPLEDVLSGILRCEASDYENIDAYADTEPGGGSRRRKIVLASHLNASRSPRDGRHGERKP